MTGLSNGRPRFVSNDEALAFHEISIEHFGGALGIRDAGLLDAALAMPRQGFGGEYAHPYPFLMAAAYAFHIAKNHPFVDGNKRTALMCCGAFLRMNGWDLLSQGTEAADAIMALIDGSMDKPAFADWLSKHCSARPSWELRDFFASIRMEHIHAVVQSAGAGLHPGRYGAMTEAEMLIPAIREANIGALKAEERGDAQAAASLRHQSLVLMGMYRIAEDMGYEW